MPIEDVVEDHAREVEAGGSNQEQAEGLGGSRRVSGNNQLGSQQDVSQGGEDRWQPDQLQPGQQR